MIEAEWTSERELIPLQGFQFVNSPFPVCDGKWVEVYSADPVPKSRSDLNAIIEDLTHKKPEPRLLVCQGNEFSSGVFYMVTGVPTENDSAWEGARAAIIDLEPETIVTVLDSQNGDTAVANPTNGWTTNGLVEVTDGNGDGTVFFVVANPVQGSCNAAIGWKMINGAYVPGFMPDQEELILGKEVLACYNPKTGTIEVTELIKGELFYVPLPDGFATLPEGIEQTPLHALGGLANLYRMDEELLIQGLPENTSMRIDVNGETSGSEWPVPGASVAPTPGPGATAWIGWQYNKLDPATQMRLFQVGKEAIGTYGFIGAIPAALVVGATLLYGGIKIKEWCQWFLNGEPEKNNVTVPPRTQSEPYPSVSPLRSDPSHFTGQGVGGGRVDVNVDHEHRLGGNVAVHHYSDPIRVEPIQVDHRHTFQPVTVTVKPDESLLELAEKFLDARREAWEARTEAEAASRRDYIKRTEAEARAEKDIIQSGAEARALEYREMMEARTSSDFWGGVHDSDKGTMDRFTKWLFDRKNSSNLPSTREE